MSDKEYDIEEIAKILFLNSPEEANTINLISVEDYDDIFYPFELLLNLYMEGVFLLGFIDLNPWFHSIGIHIIIKEHDIIDKNNYENFYCKIILRDDPIYSLWFDIKHIQKNFHFINNSKLLTDELNIKKFEDIYSIYIKENILYVIGFSLRM